MQNAKAELDSCLEVIDALKEKENEYLNLINDYEKEKECYAEHVCQIYVFLWISSSQSIFNISSVMHSVLIYILSFEFNILGFNSV